MRRVGWDNLHKLKNALSAIHSKYSTGSKKVVLKLRSVDNMVISPAGTGSDDKSRNAVTG